MELEKMCLELWSHVRPEKTEVHEYPYIVEMLVNVITLELTKEKK